MRKKILAAILLTGLLPVACTDKFDAINTDPTKASAETFDANLLLPSIQWKYVSAQAGYNGSILFQSGWMQLLSSTTSGAANYYSNADKYVISSNTNSYLASVWNTDYSAASFAYEMEQLTKDNPVRSNLTNVAIIMQAQTLSTLSDVYGDIPYMEALQAKAGVTLPAYDTQESVYKSLLQRLDAAVAGLDASKPLPANDAFEGYKGDVAKWKKYGYSLMLKMAMRLVKVDPATAKMYAEKAAAGGTFASVADDAYVRSDDANGYTNGNASALQTPADLYQVRWSKKLIDYLKASNDPRLGAIAEVPAAGLTANQSQNAGNSDPAVQMGLPNGYDMNGGATDITRSPGYPGATGTGAEATPIGKYSRPSAIYRNRNAALFVLTYAETELLLAEAVTRGFSVGSATAAAHYRNGVSAGIQSLSKLGAAIPAATADAYATANPLVPANALKQINEQYWATTGIFFNFVESWNNWKRSGYPELTPINYVGNFSGGQIPRRQLYPTGEATLNGANYTEAVNRLSGGDRWTSRIWWDK
ncbi:SusD/RagB family nutrient-binding outer membrane lipoprotein [Dyadobacter sp. Leaf189]|uniref:SusD/RagB family nutrient-binding outer membrane lipoprotein n=1 Tax=Dyadobacter sp. Leaf189 TaxID=1736295 RepID=UPI001E40C08B|nr:SusD/RagB family nutrient-binding outer membrane lipoprotein [Dyadobacter sp. Leaf189]